jgi:hypothetical protein
MKGKRMTGETLNVEDAVNETCPWSGKPISADSLTLYRERVVGFCDTGHRDTFEAATAHFDAAIAAEKTPLIARGLE